MPARGYASHRKRFCGPMRAGRPWFCRVSTLDALVMRKASRCLTIDAPATVAAGAVTRRKNPTTRKGFEEDA